MLNSEWKIEEVLLQITVDTSITDEVADSLLSYEGEQEQGFIFDSFALQQHGGHSKLKDLQEKVSGFQPKQKFEIRCRTATATDVLNHVKASLPSLEFEYQILPLMAWGNQQSLA